MRPTRLRRLLLVAMLLAGSGTARADGRIEINQTRALAGGVTGGDGAGFPVWITSPGSYVLTSDLSPGPGNVAIEIRNNPVTIDLNGFNVRGPGIGTGTASGITSNLQQAFRATIRNGTVTGFRGRGIDFEMVTQVHLDGLLVQNNAQGGIALGDHGLVTRSRVLDNGLFGLLLAGTAQFASCTIGRTTSGPSVSGGTQLGFSLCDDHRCSHGPRRRYYLTEGEVPGSQATGACATGFHMASLFELRDPSAIQYDTSLGLSFADSGQGPPRGEGVAGNSHGWVRTGNASGGDTLSPDSGEANCNVWTSGSSTIRGTVASPAGPDWADGSFGFEPSTVMSPWTALTAACNAPHSVWCIQDR